MIEAEMYSITNLLGMVEQCKALITKLRGAFSSEDFKSAEPLCKNNHILKKIMELWVKGSAGGSEKKMSETQLASIEDPSLVRIDKAGKKVFHEVEEMTLRLVQAVEKHYLHKQKIYTLIADFVQDWRGVYYLVKVNTCQTVNTEEVYKSEQQYESVLVQRKGALTKCHSCKQRGAETYVLLPNLLGWTKSK